MSHYDQRESEVSPWNYFSESDRKITLKIESEIICSDCYSRDWDDFSDEGPPYKCKCGGEGVSEIEVEFPAKYQVCGVCDGKGKVVNPAIDSNGLTQEDFDEDPDFRENYFSGMYDIECPHCHGKRVVPSINRLALNENQKRALKIYDDNVKDELEFESQCRMERMMGA